MKLFEAENKDARIKELESQKRKLFTKALKLFPNSKEQLKIADEIKAISQELEKLQESGLKKYNPEDTQNKPYYLITDKKEMIAERDRLEAIWDKKGKLSKEEESRMRDLGIQSVRVFKTPLSQLK